VEEITQADQERLLKVMRRHRKRLKQFPNVRSVDIGYEFSDRRSTGRLAIRVHVNAKQPDAELKPSERLPEEIEGIPLDVIQSNPKLHAINRDARQVPVIGGVTLGNTRPDSPPGTLGAVVFDQRSLQPMALSNYHVLVVESPQGTDMIAQPQTSATADALGNLERWDKHLDCAVCRITSRPVSAELAELGAVGGTQSPRVGMKVVKSGRTTGVTRGVIDGTDGEGFSVVPDPDFPAPGGEISDSGDSGSLWLESATLLAVGLHFAGEGDPDPAQERAFAKWMTAVEDKLSVLLLGMDSAWMGSAHPGSSCTVLGRTRPEAPCHLDVVYPSGRKSRAQGLGDKTADTDGFVHWSWTVGSSTKRTLEGDNQVKGFVTLGGVRQLVASPLEGNSMS
jgi:hypothetical protein